MVQFQNVHVQEIVCCLPTLYYAAFDWINCGSSHWVQNLQPSGGKSLIHAVCLLNDRHKDTSRFINFFSYSTNSKYNVEKLPGSNTEHILASLNHWALYGFMLVMPASGIAMGYYGGMFFLKFAMVLFFSVMFFSVMSLQPS